MSAAISDAQKKNTSAAEAVKVIEICKKITSRASYIISSESIAFSTQSKERTQDMSDNKPISWLNMVVLPMRRR